MIPRFALHKLKNAIERQRSELKLSNRRYAVAQRFKEAEKKSKDENTATDMVVTITWKLKNPSEPGLFLSRDAIYNLLHERDIDFSCQTYNTFSTDADYLWQPIEAFLMYGSLVLSKVNLFYDVAQKYQFVLDLDEREIEVYFYNLTEEEVKVVKVGLVFLNGGTFEGAINFNNTDPRSSMNDNIDDYLELGIIPYLYNIDFSFEYK